MIASRRGVDPLLTNQNKCDHNWEMWEMKEEIQRVPSAGKHARSKRQTTRQQEIGVRAGKHANLVKRKKMRMHLAPNH